jgi:hypothetical protein
MSPAKSRELVGTRVPHKVATHCSHTVSKFSKVVALVYLTTSVAVECKAGRTLRVQESKPPGLRPLYPTTSPNILVLTAAVLANLGRNVQRAESRVATCPLIPHQQSTSFAICDM